MGPILITGFEGLSPIPVMFTGPLQGKIDLQGVPCKPYRVWVCSVVRIFKYGKQFHFAPMFNNDSFTNSETKNLLSSL